MEDQTDPHQRVTDGEVRDRENAATSAAGCRHPQHGGVRQVLMSVGLHSGGGGGGGGTLELVEFDDRSFGVCRDGSPIDPQEFLAEHNVAV